MKRTFLFLALSLALTGCGSKQEGAASDNEVEIAKAEAARAKAEATKAEAEAAKAEAELAKVKAEAATAQAQQAATKAEAAASTAERAAKATQPAQTASSSASTWSWRGAIGPYKVVFNCKANKGGAASFTYRYTSKRVNQGRDIPLFFDGRSGNLESWREYINGRNTGTFTMHITRNGISGSFVNSKGEWFDVSARGTGGNWPDMASWPFD